MLFPATPKSNQKVPAAAALARLQEAGEVHRYQPKYHFEVTH
jgi:hypothetical protein